MTAHTQAVGFTGTRKGMTGDQARLVADLLHHFRERGATDFHFGLCVGADDQAAMIAGNLGYRLIAHPGVNKDGICLTRGSIVPHKELPPLPFLTRDKNIVDACDALIAAPRETFEQRRSGTWATVRYARTAARMRYIVKPYGGFEYEGGDAHGA